jgi:hypothetical protein
VTKSKIRLFSPSLILFFVLLSISGMAGAATSTTSDKSSASSTIDSAQAKRIAQRKEALKISLTELQTQILTSKCGAAQETLKNIESKDKLKADARKQTYTNMSAKINDIITKIQKQGIDTNALKSAQTQFNVAANEYLIDSDAYVVALDDSVTMKCSVDPGGIEATLLSARQYRTLLVNDSSQIKLSTANLTKALSDTKQALGNTSSRAKNEATP